MNLDQLYEVTPAGEHRNIRRVGDRVFIRTNNGTAEYLIDDDLELWLIRSDKPIKDELAQIKDQLQRQSLSK